MKCLSVHALEGKKTWEIRRQPANFRGRIALGNTKTRNHEGYATIIECRSTLSRT